MKAKVFSKTNILCIPKGFKNKFDPSKNVLPFKTNKILLRVYVAYLDRSIGITRIQTHRKTTGPEGVVLNYNKWAKYN